jgi:hypothetical protein
MNSYESILVILVQIASLRVLANHFLNSSPIHLIDSFKPVVIHINESQNHMISIDFIDVSIHRERCAKASVFPNVTHGFPSQEELSG